MLYRADENAVKVNADTNKQPTRQQAANQWNNRNNNPSQQATGAQQKPIGGPQQMRFIAAASLPDDYVTQAQKVFTAFTAWTITANQLRNILDLAMNMFNVESQRTEEKIADNTKGKILRTRVQIVYSAGRDGNRNPVKDFIDITKLLDYLEQVGDDRKKLLNWIHYLEALVAYHRYYGGKEVGRNG